MEVVYTAQRLKLHLGGAIESATGAGARWLAFGTRQMAGGEVNSVWPKSKSNIVINVLECFLRGEDSHDMAIW